MRFALRIGRTLCRDCPGEYSDQNRRRTPETRHGQIYQSLLANMTTSRHPADLSLN